MARPILPPRGIFTGTHWVFDAQLPAGIKETLLQIMALTWASPGRATPPLSYAQLEAMTGKDARTLRGHFSALRTYHAALRLQPAGAGQFLIVLANWLFTNSKEAVSREAFSQESSRQVVAAPKIAAAPQIAAKTARASLDEGKNPPQPDQENQEEDSILSKSEQFLPPVDHDDVLNAQMRISSAAAKESPQQAEGLVKPLTRGLQKQIQELGVFPGLMGEVTVLARAWKYSERELKALLEWCKDDQPDRPAGLFIGRIRAGGRAPAGYAIPPCRRCGLRGKHAPDCPARYELP